MLTRFARFRVPLGFLSAALALLLARPTWSSWRAGLAVAVLGSLLRLWAAGHIDKGREITQSGPYRFVRHPLYLGSTLLGAGFAVASWNVPVAIVTALYLSVTLAAAIRVEERRLDTEFSGAYTDYRAGRVQASGRRFSWARVAANREHRALLGMAAVFAFLWWRMRG